MKWRNCRLTTKNSDWKGQLISKCSFGMFKLTKKTNNCFVKISAQASKKRSNQKSKGTNWMNLLQLSYTTIFLFDLRKKSLLGFLVYLKTPKEHFEINWPLVRSAHVICMALGPTLMLTLVSLWESFNALLNTFRSSSRLRVAPGNFCWSVILSSNNDKN